MNSGNTASFVFATASQKVKASREAYIAQCATFSDWASLASAKTLLSSEKARFIACMRAFLPPLAHSDVTFQVTALTAHI